MQQVHVGITKSGLFGLFTGNYLACYLDPEMTAEQVEAKAKRMGFELVGKPMTMKQVLDLELNRTTR